MNASSSSSSYSDPVNLSVIHKCDANDPKLTKIIIDDRWNTHEFERICSALQKNTFVKRLNVRRFHGTINIHEFRYVLCKNSSLTDLHLYSNNIGDGGARAISEGLCSNTSLTKLWLSNNTIGDDGARAIGEGLCQNTSLTELYIYINKIGDDGARAISEGLCQNRSLTTLHLSNNNIGDDGTHAISKGLCNNTSLTELHLSDNNIGDDGARAISEGLCNNTSLTKLNLSDNNIGDDGARAISEGLCSNTSLKGLCLQNNSIGDDGARAINEGLCTNTSLTTLNLYVNKIGDDGCLETIELYTTLNKAGCRLLLESSSTTADQLVEVLASLVSITQYYRTDKLKISCFFHVLSNKPEVCGMHAQQQMNQAHCSHKNEMLNNVM